MKNARPAIKAWPPLRAWSLGVLACALLGACSFAPKEARPAPRQAAALALHGQAAAALARGEHAEAEKLYLRALTQERAIENLDGIAANLLGLAVTYQRAGQPAQAERQLALLLDNEILNFAPAARAEALFIKATLVLGDGQDEKARGLVDQAQALCDLKTCALTHRLLELQARIAIAGNRIDEALAVAPRAVALAREQKNEAALADALRTQANAWLYRTPATGLPLAEEALTLDKKLARPDRIFGDLMLLAKLHADGGDPAQSRKMYQRARLVAQADGNRAGLAELARMEHELNNAAK